MKWVNHFCAAVIALYSSHLLFSSASFGIFYFKSFISFREVCLMWIHNIITYHTFMHMKEVNKYAFVGFLFFCYANCLNRIKEKDQASLITFQWQYLNKILQFLHGNDTLILCKNTISF